jgi:hypothetical protein
MEFLSRDNVQLFISILASVIAIISIVVAYLSYSYSKSIRMESSQLRIVDKLSDVLDLIQSNTVTVDSVFATIR